MRAQAGQRRGLPPKPQHQQMYTAHVRMDMLQLDKAMNLPTLETVTGLVMGIVSEHELDIDAPKRRGRERVRSYSLDYGANACNLASRTTRARSNSEPVVPSLQLESRRLKRWRTVRHRRYVDEYVDEVWDPLHNFATAVTAAANWIFLPSPRTMHWSWRPSKQARHPDDELFGHHRLAFLSGAFSPPKA